MSDQPQPKPKLRSDKDGIPIDDPSIRGWSRYFNNRTIRGRANVAKATLSVLLLGTIYYKFGRSPSAPKSSVRS